MAGFTPERMQRAPSSCTARKSFTKCAAVAASIASTPVTSRIVMRERFAAI